MYFSKTPMEWDEKIPLGRQDLQDLLDFLSPAAKRPLAEGPFILIILSRRIFPYSKNPYFRLSISIFLEHLLDR